MRKQSFIVGYIHASRSKRAGCLYIESPVVISWGLLLEGGNSLASSTFFVSGQRKSSCKCMQEVPVRIWLVGVRVDVASIKQCIGYHCHHHPRNNHGTKGHNFHDWEQYTCLPFPRPWLTIGTHGISGLGTEGWVWREDEWFGSQIPGSAHWLSKLRRAFFLWTSCLSWTN